MHGGSQLFFFFYAIGQLTLEMALLIFCTTLVRKYLGKTAFNIAIAITFIGLLLHLLDYIMERILDLSVWEAVYIFVLQESFENFVQLLAASGIPIWAWIVILFGAISIPLLGIGLYKLTEKIVLRWPLRLRNHLFLQTFLCMPCALLLWDFSCANVIHPDAYTAFTKSLPWKYTFLHPRNLQISQNNYLKAPLSENEVATIIQEDKTTLNSKPNIYFFITESLREDVITNSIAPNLAEFKNDNAHFDLALSNGNGTHISWFSAFHSQFPFYWSDAQKNWKMGSPALNLMKKWGYKIHLYTSAQLEYYGMDKLIFGDQLQLIDSYQTFHHSPPLQAADTDTLALEKLQKDIRDNPKLQEGQIFIIFWDGTHFDYSWPKNWTPKFTPFSKEMAYFKAIQSEKTISKIKNRYYNSVNYMDSLFGQFYNNLPNKEESIVIFMGDHGEEFFEHGHLFHNSHLTNEQTNIPLYFKFGNNKRKMTQLKIASQMNIFPTLLDYLKGDSVTFLEGASLFQAPKRPFVLTSRFNGGAAPYEFAINNGTYKLIAQFGNRKDILQSKELRIISLRSSQDQTIPESKTDLREWIEKGFGKAFSHLFTQTKPD